MQVMNVGKILRQKREELSLSLEAVSKETNISIKFLKALEENKFDVFSASTYIVGFLSSYAEVLGLDPQEMVSMYHKQISYEKEFPISEIIETKKDFFKFFKNTGLYKGPKIFSSSRVGKIFIRLGIGILLFLLLILLVSQCSKGMSDILSGNFFSSTYNFNEVSMNEMKKNFYKKGDKFLLDLPDHEVKIEIKDIDPKLETARFKINGKEFTLKEKEMIYVDTNEDDMDDFRLDLLSVQDNLLQINPISLDLSAKADLYIKSLGEDYLAQTKKNNVVLLKSNQKPETTEVFLQANGTVWLGILTSEDNKMQVKVLKRDETLKLNFKHYIVLSVGNASRLNVNVGNTLIEAAGDDGAVTKLLYYWDSNGVESQLMKTVLN